MKSYHGGGWRGRDLTYSNRPEARYSAEMVGRSSAHLYRSSPDSGLKNYSVAAQGTIQHLRGFGHPRLPMAAWITLNKGVG